MAVVRGTGGAKRAAIASWRRHAALMAAHSGSTEAAAAACAELAVATAERDIALREAAVATRRADQISSARQQLVLKLEEQRQAMDDMRGNLEEQHRSWRAQLAHVVTENAALKVNTHCCKGNSRTFASFSSPPPPPPSLPRARSASENVPKRRLRRKNVLRSLPGKLRKPPG